MKRLEAPLLLLTLFALSSVLIPQAAGAAPGDEVVRPFTLDPTPRLHQRGWQALPGAVEEFLVDVDPQAVAADPETVLLDLPGGPPVEAHRQRFTDYGADWKSWFGTVHAGGAGGPEIGTVYLGYHGSQLTAWIDVEGRRYRITGGVGGGHRLVRIAPRKLTDALCPLDTAVPSRSAPLAEPGSRLRSGLGLGEDPILVTHALTRLDVIAVYPKAFFPFVLSEVDLHNEIEDAIALGNNAFTNSGISAFYNLRYIGPLIGAQPPATGLIGGLNWMNTDPSEVVALRTAFGADIVTLYIPFIWDDNPYCGVANLPEANGTIVAQLGIIDTTFGDRTYTVNRQSCGFGDYTLPHEIGHNYGMRHDTDTTGSSHLFPNGRGHDLTTLGKSTLMACTCVPSGCTAGTSAVCNRILQISDPAIFYQGVATGTSNRNNAAVGRTQVGPYSNFRPVKSNTPPTASFSVSCTGRTCTFNASASTDNQTIPTGGYWWDFGDGTTGTGKIVNRTYAGTGTFFWVHLLVTDSGGQKDLGIDIAQPN
jgi:hypothetical protein